jgi:hypothetical protein
MPRVNTPVFAGEFLVKNVELVLVVKERAGTVLAEFVRAPIS